jgi:two-component system, OmpR family, phosphate regulon response regulator OmpR
MTLSPTPAVQTSRAKPIKPIADDAPHLLVVDDDRRIRELLSRYLADHGFRVSVAADAGEARRKLESLEFDLLVVDVMMPGETGVLFTRSLRENSAVPVLMLTALAETESRITGLEAGADDYLSKPFEPRELVLRINSILKRTAKPVLPAFEQVSFGPWMFSVKKRELRLNGEDVRLTDREQEIMLAFAARPGDTIARHELLGGENSASGERKIDVQINRLRRKIEEDPANPKWLQTVRGIGYRLCVD